MSVIPPEEAERCRAPHDRTECEGPEGFHCYCWYERDEPCCHCGTTDLNIWLDGEQISAITGSDIAPKAEDTSAGGIWPGPDAVRGVQ